MAVAAYASLLLLMKVLDNVQHPFRRRQLRFDADRVQSLHEKLQFLVDFLERHSQRMSQEMEDLAGQIVAAADEAEDFIDTHVVDQLREGSQDQSYHLAVASSFCQDIDRVTGKIDSITTELTMIEEGWANAQERKPVVSNLPTSSTALPSSVKNTMIGFDEHLLRVMDELTRDESNLQILPLVGMGGTGKTTLARNIFDHPYVVHHFDKRIWFTISQDYSVHEILVCLLNNGKDKEVSETSAELGERLYKSLFGQRYIIIMDDVWNIKAWDALKLFFPNNRNGSRVIMTTRLANVANSLGSQKPYLMDFLDEDKSWNLFCLKAFAKEGCPYPELEEIGKDIAKACRGLPLAIVVIGGLLANSNMEQEYWKYFAKNVSSFVNSEDDEHCLKILALSYQNLPMHLKACFLYMRVFREDDKIKVSRLIKLWIGEGFLKPKRGKILEEVAKEYLKNLVDRNLVLIREWTVRGKPRVCGIHDLLRDLCLKEADKEHFIRTPIVQLLDPYKENEIVCFLCGERVSLQETIDVPKIVIVSQLTSGASGLVCEACKKWRIGHLIVSTTSSIYISLNHCLFKTEDSLLKNIAYPTSLKKLNLVRCKIPCEYMTIIGSLPNLEVIFWRWCDIEGSEWNPIEGQFPRLKMLKLWKSNLMCWRAENIHFPNLEKLCLYYMHDLEEIPSGIGDIATLSLIHVLECNESVVKSAMQILEEQQSNGNEDLQVLVH
ncbi:putative late blight resistance proteinR1A-10 [Sesamum angolense]|uniref:Late blight resistance proteinR1A-10 n=1 Tax=Sesamum angolense TaxID=2727404 RepID=A0AAE1WK37_9LAMI|nr:putative late blight resistance proteinR1A-10 [Sesamum angolense]